VVRSLVVAALIAAVVSCTESRGVSVDEVYSPLPPTSDVAAVYLVIHNPTVQPDTLLAIVAPSAQRAEVHRQVTQNGMMFQMERVETLPIPARDSVVLAPGGVHVMLFGLRRRPAVGDTIDLVFQFRRAREVAAHALVKSRSELGR